MTDDRRYLSSPERLRTHRRHLPHWQKEEVTIFLTWRLADSIPAGVLEKWRREKDAWVRAHPRPWSRELRVEYQRRFVVRMERWMDRGWGSCVLKRPECGSIVARGLRHFEGERCGMEAFVVMPNHVHVLFRLRKGWTLESLCRSWKGFTAREIHKLLGSRGTLWQQEYWDRIVRNERHYEKCRGYILENPSKAGLGAGEYVLYDKRGA